MEFFAEDKLDEAVAAYRQALEKDPRYADALHALAMAYANQNNLDAAIEAGKMLVEISPDDELAHTSLSIFYQRKGMIAEAEHVGAKARTLGWKRELQDKRREEEKK
jgi:tetratricopeptide (TPR) repeat protein